IIFSIGGIGKQIGNQRYHFSRADRNAIDAAHPLDFKEAFVTGEQLVATVAGERHLYVLGGKLRYQIGRNGGRIGKRLVEMVHQLRDQVERIWADDDFVVICIVFSGDRGGQRQLVELGLLEADGKSFHWLLGLQ